MKHSLTFEELNDLIVQALCTKHRVLIDEEAKTFLPRKAAIKGDLQWNNGEPTFTWWVEPRG